MQPTVNLTANSGNVRELAALFLRLGLTAFGGPAAHIAMMHTEVVAKRKWLTETEFLDTLALCNLIPGPNSTELAIHVGYRRAGIPGLLVAGSCFILPAACLCTLIAWLYTRLGHLPVTENLLYAIKPVVIAIIIQALYKLAKATLKSRLLLIAAILAAAANFYFEHELLVLFATAAIVLLIRISPFKKGTPLLSLLPALPSAATMTAATTATAALAPAALLPLFLTFLKIGSVLFGSGYVLLAFLQADLVEHHHWLKQSELLDAVAVGQFTPGPVFTTATFIGYILRDANGQPLGPPGAIAATLGIFLPAFFFVAVTAPLMPRLRNSKTAAHFLDGLNAASLALMFVVTFHLAHAALFPQNHPDLLSVAVTILSLALLLYKPTLNSAWLILAAALLSLALPR